MKKIGLVQSTKTRVPKWQNYHSEKWQCLMNTGDLSERDSLTVKAFAWHAADPGSNLGDGDFIHYALLSALSARYSYIQ